MKEVNKISDTELEIKRTEETVLIRTKADLEKNKENLESDLEFINQLLAHFD